MPFFLGWIEVTKDQVREPLPDPPKHRQHPQGLAMPGDGIHDVPVSHRIEVQVSPLDLVYRMGFHEGGKRVCLLGGIGESRTVQVVDRDKPVPRQGKVYTLENIGESVPLGSEIGVIADLSHAVGTDTDTIQTGIEKPRQYLGSAAIGVYVYGAFTSLLPDQPDGRFDHMGCQQRIPFTPLSKADNRMRRPTDVGEGHFGNFIGGGGEGDPILTRGYASIVLQRNASKATGIALPGSG